MREEGFWPRGDGASLCNTLRSPPSPPPGGRHRTQDWTKNISRRKANFAQTWVTTNRAHRDHVIWENYSSEYTKSTVILTNNSGSSFRTMRKVIIVIADLKSSVTLLSGTFGVNNFFEWEIVKLESGIFFRRWAVHTTGRLLSSGYHF